MEIIVVEDDNSQFKELKENLQREFHSADIERITTASEFREKLKRLGEHRPDIVLIDVMIPWQTNTEELLSAPPEVLKSEYRNLGVLCAQWLVQGSKTAKIPIILYTELDRTSPSLEGALQTLPDHVQYLRKDSRYIVLNRLTRELSKGVFRKRIPTDR